MLHEVKMNLNWCESCGDLKGTFWVLCKARIEMQRSDHTVIQMLASRWNTYVKHMNNSNLTLKEKSTLKLQWNAIFIPILTKIKEKPAYLFVFCWWWDNKWYKSMEGNSAITFKTKNVLILQIYFHVHKITCTKILVTALLVYTNCLKRPNCPSVEDQ